MKKSILCAAGLFAGLAIAGPMLAWSADPESQSAQSAPIQEGAGTMAPMGRGMPPMMGGMRTQMEPMRQGRMWRMMAGRSPREHCEERLARRAGLIAYTVTKLNLTPEQRPLWDKLNGIVQAATDRERQLCASLPAGEERGQETILDRVNRREQLLSARLEALQQAKPALEALYHVLSPDQKAIVDHRFRR
jgi:spore germination cell wall hydrolase CwlJ-like protein